MKRERKDHPVWFALKFAAFLSFVVIPILAWQKGQNFWARLHDKESEQ